MTTSTSAGGRIDIVGQRHKTPFRRNIVATIPADSPVETWDVTSATVTISSLYDKLDVECDVTVSGRTLAVDVNVDTTLLNPAHCYEWELVLTGSDPFNAMQLVHGTFDLYTLPAPPS